MDLNGHYFSFATGGDPTKIVDRFEARQKGTKVTYYRNGAPGQKDPINSATARPCESYFISGRKLNGPVIGTVQENGDITYMHGYTSRLESESPDVVANKKGYDNVMSELTTKTGKKTSPAVVSSKESYDTVMSELTTKAVIVKKPPTYYNPTSNGGVVPITYNKNSRDGPCKSQPEASVVVNGFTGYNARLNGEYHAYGEQLNGMPVYSHSHSEGVGAGHDWCRMWYSRGAWRIGHFTWINSDNTLCVAFANSNAVRPHYINFCAVGAKWMEHKGQGAGRDFGCDPSDFKFAGDIVATAFSATDRNFLKLGSTPSRGNPASTNALNTELNNVARNTDDTDRARSLVVCGADLASTNGEAFKHTPLHQAAYHGRFEMARTLVELGAPLDMHSNPCGRGTNGTPLELAQGGGHHEIVDLLEQAAARDGVCHSASFYVDAMSYEDLMKSLNKLVTTEGLQKLANIGKPDVLWMMTIEVVCMLIGEECDWRSAKMLLGDREKLMQKLNAVDPDNISSAVLQKVNEYTSNAVYKPDIVGSDCFVVKLLCRWTLAVVSKFDSEKDEYVVVGDDDAAPPGDTEALRGMGERIQGVIHLKREIRMVESMKLVLNNYNLKHAKEKVVRLGGLRKECANNLAAALPAMQNAERVVSDALEGLDDVEAGEIQDATLGHVSRISGKVEIKEAVLKEVRAKQEHLMKIEASYVKAVKAWKVRQGELCYVEAKLKALKEKLAAMEKATRPSRYQQCD